MSFLLTLLPSIFSNKSAWNDCTWQNCFCCGACVRISYGENELMVTRRNIVGKIHEKSSEIISTNRGTDLHKGGSDQVWSRFPAASSSRRTVSMLVSNPSSDSLDSIPASSKYTMTSLPAAELVAGKLFNHSPAEYFLSKTWPVYRQRYLLSW